MGSPTPPWLPGPNRIGEKTILLDIKSDTIDFPHTNRLK